jgi:hypothetical protein
MTNTRTTTTVPEWLNLGVLITPDEITAVAVVVDELRALVAQAAAIAPRVQWAQHLGDRIDGRGDDVLPVFDVAIGSDEIYGLVDEIRTLLLVT